MDPVNPVSPTIGAPSVLITSNNSPALPPIPLTTEDTTVSTDSALSPPVGGSTHQPVEGYVLSGPGNTTYEVPDPQPLAHRTTPVPWDQDREGQDEQDEAIVDVLLSVPSDLDTGANVQDTTELDGEPREEGTGSIDNLNPEVVVSGSAETGTSGSLANVSPPSNAQKSQQDPRSFQKASTWVPPHRSKEAVSSATDPLSTTPITQDPLHGGMIVAGSGLGVVCFHKH